MHTNENSSSHWLKHFSIKWSLAECSFQKYGQNIENNLGKTDFWVIIEIIIEIIEIIIDIIEKK